MVDAKRKLTTIAAGIALVLGASAAAHADPLKATVIHWWTSGGESAAIKEYADAYNKAGGQWNDNAIAGGEQINRPA